MLRAEEMILMGLEVQADSEQDDRAEDDGEETPTASLLAAIEGMGDIATLIEIMADAARGAGDMHEGEAAGRCHDVARKLDEVRAILRVDR